MTIKCRWTDKKGIVHEKTIHPSHKERIIWEARDSEGKPNTWYKGIIRIVTHDEIQLEGRESTSVNFTGIRKEEWSKNLKQENINLFFESGLDRVTDRKVRDISFVWEPTLPTAARK